MILFSFLKRYSLKQQLVLLLEEYAGFLTRYLPGYEGMLMRWLLYGRTFRKLGWHPLIWPNVFITHSYNIKAGRNLCLNYGAHIDGRGGVDIGDQVLIGPNVFIGSSNHIITPDKHIPRLYSGHILKRVKIGNNVWIGANAVICPGVSIGDHSIIGAGSIVTTDMPDAVLAVGNPAKVIKSIANN